MSSVTIRGMCEDCGDEPAVKAWDTDPYGEGPRSLRHVYVCARCYGTREDYDGPGDPPEPQQADGYRPTVAEMQVDAMRVKR